MTHYRAHVQHAHSTSLCNTRHTHARRVRGVRAECGGMRYGFYFFVPSPVRGPRVGDRVVAEMTRRTGRRDEEGSPHPTFDPRHPRSTSCRSPHPLSFHLPLPRFWDSPLSRSSCAPLPPPPLLSLLHSLADSRTHLPPVPTLGALAPDVTSRRTPPSPRLLVHRDEKRVHARRTPRRAYKRHTREGRPARSATTTTMLLRVPTSDLIHRTPL